MSELIKNNPAPPPRILLVTAQYFLMGELTAAFDRNGVQYQLLDFNTREMDLDIFVQTINDALHSFHPHCVMTVNHLGVDHEGVLLQLLDQRKIPLVSWFVDNPLLILPTYKGLPKENTILFTWDTDTIADLKQDGFKDVFHLPLGADPTRFTADSTGPLPEKWKTEVSFVGNSMVHKTTKRLQVSAPPAPLLQQCATLAKEFGESDERNVSGFIKKHYPQLLPQLQTFTSASRLAAFETAVTWYSTLLYRLECVRETLPFTPLVLGDKGWNDLLPADNTWNYHPEVSYYTDLPVFYQCSDINFNCTSQQMKGAVNQRVFDVPTAGGFLLTDYRAQIEKLFDPETEIVFYNDINEIRPLIEEFLNKPELRQKITQAARKRILHEHTYDHRIASLLTNLASLGIHGEEKRYGQ